MAVSGQALSCPIGRLLRMAGVKDAYCLRELLSSVSGKQISSGVRLDQWQMRHAGRATLVLD